MKPTVAEPAAAGWSEQAGQLLRLWRAGRPAICEQARALLGEAVDAFCRSELAREAFGDTDGLVIRLPERVCQLRKLAIHRRYGLGNAPSRFRVPFSMNR